MSAPGNQTIVDYVRGNLGYHCPDTRSALARASTACGWCFSARRTRGSQEPLEQGVDVHPRPKPRAQQERPDQLAVQENGLRRRRAQAALESHRDTEIAGPRGEAGTREVVGAALAEWLADELDDLDGAMDHVGGVVRVHVADLEGCIADRHAVAGDDGTAEAPVTIGELG